MKLPRPAYWGKLPAYGDFLRHGAPLEIQDAWRAWLAGPLARARVASTSATDQGVPWGFVMTPGCMAFSRDRYVAGIYADSCDKFGREHPFLMWFQLDCAGVSALLSVHDNALFHLSRLLLGHLKAPSVSAAEGLLAQINRLWRPQGRGVWSALRGSRDGPDFLLARAWTDGLRSDKEAAGLVGIPYSPWRDWPVTVFGDSVQAWYWQQDGQAGYVSFLSVGPEALAGGD